MAEQTLDELEEAAIRRGLETGDFSDALAVFRINRGIPDPNFIQRTSETVSEAGQKIQDIWEEPGMFGSEDTAQLPPAVRRQLEGTQAGANLLEKSMRTAGKGVIQPASRIMMDALGSSLGGLKEPAKVVTEPVVLLAEKLAETDAVAEGLNILKTGFTNYLEWQDESPENRQIGELLESTLDVALIASPTKKVPLPSGNFSREIGVNLIRGGRAKIKGTKEKLMDSLHFPEVKKQADSKRWQERGKLRKSTYEPDALDRDITQTLMDTPNINPKRSYLYNKEQMQIAIDTEAAQLVSRIKAAGNPKINREDILATLRRKSQESVSETATFQGNVEGVYNRIYAEMERLLSRKNISTATDYLQLRKDLDKYLSGGPAGSVYNAEWTVATQSASKVFRETINEAVELAVPKIAVKQSLTRQHHLYVARDRTWAKAIKDADIALWNMAHNWSKVQQRFGVRMPVTPLAIGATATTALHLAQSNVMPWLTGTAAAAGGVYFMTKAGMSPALRKGLGQSLIGLGKAIRQVKNKRVVEQLRADRALIISLLQDMPVAKDDETEPRQEASNG